MTIIVAAFGTMCAAILVIDRFIESWRSSWKGARIRSGAPAAGVLRGSWCEWVRRKSAYLRSAQTRLWLRHRGTPIHCIVLLLIIATQGIVDALNAWFRPENCAKSVINTGSWLCTPLGCMLMRCIPMRYAPMRYMP